jgi:hypothetical protein
LVAAEGNLVALVRRIAHRLTLVRPLQSVDPDCYEKWLVGLDDSKAVHEDAGGSRSSDAWFDHLWFAEKMRALWDRTWVVVGIFAAVLVGGIVIFLFLSRPDPEIAQPPERGVQLHTGAEDGERPHIDYVRAILDELPAMLSAGSTTALTEPLVPARPQLAQFWPVGARTVLDPATWARTGDIASVQVEVSVGATTTRALVTLSFEKGQWRLLNVEGLTP